MKKTLLILSVMLILAGSAFIMETAPMSSQSGLKVNNTEPSQKMITARIFIKPGMEEEFIKSAQWIIDNTHKEAGCLEYTLYQDPHNKSNFFFFERYKDQSAIDAHFGAAYFKEFGTKINSWLAKPSEVKIYDISESK
jgi:quinol monooxygenase YgiN